MSGSSTILVVGAAGRFAGLVVPASTRRGVNVRGEEQAKQARLNGVAEIAMGELRDRGSLDAALQGVERAFYLAPVYQEDEARMGLSFVEAARAAGLRRVVFSSAIHPVIGVLPMRQDRSPSCVRPRDHPRAIHQHRHAPVCPPRGRLGRDEVQLLGRAHETAQPCGGVKGAKRVQARQAAHGR